MTLPSCHVRWLSLVGQRLYFIHFIFFQSFIFQSFIKKNKNTLSLNKYLQGMHKYKESPNVQAQIMYQRDQLQSKISLRWQGKQPHHNPLFTAYSSSNWVWVGWLHIIKIQARCEILLLRAIERNPDLTFWMDEQHCVTRLMVVMFAEARYRNNITAMLKSSTGQILMMQDGTQSKWNCSIPRVAFEGCIWKAIKSQPCAEGCSLSENRATPKNLSPIQGSIRYVFAWYSWGALKQRRRRRLCGLYQIYHSNGLLI